MAVAPSTFMMELLKHVSDFEALESCSFATQWSPTEIRNLSRAAERFVCRERIQEYRLADIPKPYTALVTSRI